MPSRQINPLEVARIDAKSTKSFKELPIPHPRSMTVVSELSPRRCPGLHAAREISFAQLLCVWYGYQLRQSMVQDYCRCVAQDFLVSRLPLLSQLTGMLDRTQARTVI